MTILKVKKEDDNAKITCLMVDENGDSTNVKVFRLKVDSAEEEPVTEETVPVEEAAPPTPEKMTPDVVAVVTEAAMPEPTKESESEKKSVNLDPVPGGANSFSLCSTLATVMVTIYALAS